MGLAEGIQSMVGQPASVRIGTVTSISPLVISAEGIPFDNVGILVPFTPAVDMVVALLGQSSQVGSDPASWLCLGPPVSPAETPVPKGIEEGTDIALATTVFTAGTPICGVDFVAPPSGLVRLDWHSRFESNTINVRTLVSARVGTGATLDGGTPISDARDNSALENHQEPTTAGASTRLEAGMWRLVSGLVPGDTYNAVVKMRNIGVGNGTIFDRSILVTPL